MWSTHIVGGEMIYDQLGNANYRITLKVYRDCYNGVPPFDGDFSGGTSNVSTAYITVYKSNGNVLVGRYNIGAPIITFIPPSINNPCIITPNNVCVEEGVYTYTLNLPPITGGYDVIYQRCCRNQTILNIVTPGAVGATYYAHINGPEVVMNNSSPRFKKFPPIFICNNLNIAFDHSATDPDGDQLVYSLCAPYSGLSGCCPSIYNAISAPNSNSSCVSPPPYCDTVAAPPPYLPVVFNGTYSGSIPMASNPLININQATGFLNGKPTMLGQWVVGVCVSEFRNGQKIGEHYRDFQFNVVSCSVTVVSIIDPQEKRCEGNSFNFVNQSIGGTTFSWNFGVPGTLADTSSVPNPTYTYQDTGKYVVTLITNPNKPCADTTKDTFYVYPKLQVNFIPPAKQCLKGNAFNFDAQGVFINSVTFKWDLTSHATPSVASTKTVTGVVFDTSGVYTIKLYGKQITCIDSFLDTIRVIDRPRAKIRNFPTKLCDPARVAFSNGTTSELPVRYLWQFSDGTTSTEFEPLKTFTPPGVYSITLLAITDTLCKDTSKFTINTVTVHPTPVADFVATPTVVSIFDAEILFTNMASYDVTDWEYDYGDGIGSTIASGVHVYRNYGDYKVTQKVRNTFNCRDSITKDIKILPEHRFWIPNTFTPNNDNRNEVFMPAIIGVTNYEFEIYNRWGELIFKTNDTERGWNGKIGDKLCKQDVYVWRILFKNVVTLKNEQHTGHVLLLRDDF
jgi:gliding motility-associated-like protein